jgi:RNA polymerase sigma-70 factor, ECF subfamily
VLTGCRLEAEIPFLRRAFAAGARDAADAEDLVQDTLMRALASAHQGDPGSNLRARLTTIMRNQCPTTAARSQRDKLAGGIGAQRSRHVYGPRTAAHRDVERAFKRLPESQRSAVVERTTG